MDWLEKNINSIVCGDSYELIKKIPDKSIDCIYTDIPYLYKQVGGGGCFKGKLHRKQLDLYNIKDGIDLDILKEFVRVMKKINCFIWCSRLQIMDILNYFSKFTSNYEVLVWCKTNPLPTTHNCWLSDVEYCLYFREKGVALKDGYELKSKYYESGLNQNDKLLYKHPTIKPSNLVKRHLEHALIGGGLVLDPFSGSGTTCVACKELGFEFIGIEIDEKWHEISIDRLNGINAQGQTSIFTEF